MNLARFVRLLVRESRGSRGRLVFFAVCLAAGVAGVVSVAGLSAGLAQGIRMQGRQLLGADMVVASRRELPPAVDAFFALHADTRRTDVIEMTTLVARPQAGGVPGASELVQLKVVAGEFPLYGKLVLDPPGTLLQALTPDTTAVASDLLSRLGLRVGDELRIGQAQFTIAAAVTAEPEAIASIFTLGPHVFVSPEGLERSELRKFGSIVRHRALFRLAGDVSADEVRALEVALEDSLPDNERISIDTYPDAQPELRRGLARVGSYLGLVALLSLLIGGVGVAQTVRAWLAGRVDAIAIQKCLGLRPREIFALYVGQTLVLGCIGSAAGVVLGVIAQALLPQLLREFVPPELLELWQPAAIVRGLLLGIGVSVLFSLQPLIELRSISPALVLRRDAQGLPPSRLARWSTIAAVLAGVFATAWIQARSALLAAEFCGGLVLLSLALWGAARALIGLARRLPRAKLALPVRHALAALARPGSGTIEAALALGMGVLVVLGMRLVQNRLDRELATALPTEAPSVFLLDVQTDQWDGISALLTAQGATHIEKVPLLTARLAAIDGKSVAEIAREERADDADDPAPSEQRADGRSAREGGRDARNARDDERNAAPRDGGGRRRDERDGGGRRGRRGRWSLTREQRLTYLDQLPPDNRIVEGALWSDPTRNELSLEREYADSLHVTLGSVLSFDIQGVVLDLTVTSLREVDWRSFAINFFLVAEPSALRDAPQSVLASARLAPSSEQSLQDHLAAEFPNTTMIRVRGILEKVANALGRLGLGVRILGAASALAGIAILAGAIGASSLRREREVALYKALGMTRGGLVLAFALEYALVGLVAGTIGALGAVALAWGVLEHVMEISFEASALVVIAAILGAAFLSALAGLAASVRALTRRPVEVLRA